MNIKWDKKYEIGHDKIDGEHKIFLDLIVTLDQYATSDASKERVLSHLEELKLYAKFHFASEENLMADIGYPALKEHRSEHSKLLSLLDSMTYDFIHGITTLDGVIDFAFQWFALHTTHVDNLIVQYIQQLEKNKSV